MKRIKRVHMVGIGGSGMSGIAEVLLNLGYFVSGSDLSQGETVRRLRKLGAEVFLGHREENVGKADVVVYSSAISEENPEIREAKRQGIPVIPRAEMLAELMRLKTALLVAGTHGKTTTTSLLGTVFKEAGMDPTVIIGGRLNAYGTNALLGKGEYLIAEADESDGSFLCLFPIMSIVTNIDADHMDFYPDIDSIKDAFVRFLNLIPFYGMNVVCGDDKNIRDILPRVKRPVMTYGLERDNFVHGKIVKMGPSSVFRVLVDGKEWGEVSLSLPGRHNVLNALGVIGLSLYVGIPREAILKGLSRFKGVGRRLERRGEREGVVVIDDYGHHPTEISRTLEALRELYRDRRVVVVFQPHRFTRTRALFGEFCRCFKGADVLLVTEIYPASEEPIVGVNGENLARGIRQFTEVEVIFCQDLQGCLERLYQEVRSGDVILTLGAGDIWKVGEAYVRGETKI